MSRRGMSWSDQELAVLIEVYRGVLEDERADRPVNKKSRLEAAEAELPGRTHHTLIHRACCISEVLDRHGKAWVRGWKPSALSGQRPCSPGMVDSIERNLGDLSRWPHRRR